MNGKDLLEGMSHVEERYVDEAETQTIKKSANLGWRKWAPLAACLCVVIFGALSFGRFWNPNQPTGGESSNLEMEPEAGQPESGILDSIAEMQPESNQEGEDNGFTEECPSVIVRVDAWQEDGFLGTVAEIVDTDIFEIGTELTVLFDGETTEEDFPAGSLVQVQFVSYEEETGTLLVSMISEP